MDEMKLKTTAAGRALGFYAQGEYKADLSGDAVLVKPVFARHLVAMGYAEDTQPEAESKDALAKLTKAELIKRATDKGLAIDTAGTKAEMIDVILTGKPAGLPVFVERPQAEAALPVSQPSVGKVAAVPTDELVLKDGTGVLDKGGK